MTNAGIEGQSTFLQINDAGQIAGIGYMHQTPRNFIVKDGQLTALPDNMIGRPSGINKQGDVIFMGGTMAHSDGTAGPSIVVPPGTYLGNTTSINSAGQITGTIDILPSYEPHAFVYRNGVMTDIDPILHGHGTFAPSVNEAGLVLVDPNNSNSSTRLSGPVLYDSKTGSVTHLGSLSGLQGFYGDALNNLGQVAGRAYNASDHTTHLVLFNQGELTDVSSLIPASAGWRFESVNGMNDAGQIIGYGRNPSGQEHAFLITPDNSNVSTVPEPSTMALLSLASVVVIARRIVGHCRRRGTRASSV